VAGCCEHDDELWGFHKMTGISRVAEKGSVSQERVCCMELVISVLILTEEFAVDLGSCLCWGKSTVPCLCPATDVFQLQIRI
jgi:hypothetical protein